MCSLSIYINSISVLFHVIRLYEFGVLNAGKISLHITICTRKKYNRDPARAWRYISSPKCIRSVLSSYVVTFEEQNR